MYYRVLVASRFYHGNEPLTYQSKEVLKRGQIVNVPLQNHMVTGVVTEETSKPDFSTKHIHANWPVYLPTVSLKFLDWLFSYYPAPLGLVAELLTPPKLPKNITLPASTKLQEPNLSRLPELTSEQSAALQQMRVSGKGSLLLHGDTGSGKTRLYIERAHDVIKEGRSAIILTPEIGLTKPLEETFRAVLGDRVLITHSNMTLTQRRAVWLQANVARHPYVVIGPRSAIFIPFQRVGLIVLDEVHDPSYKQEQLPRYQTSRLAAELAKLHGAQLIMGSATPSVADYYLFKSKKLPIIRMTTPAIPVQQKTDYLQVDIRNKDRFRKSPWLSNELLTSIETATENREQSLLFLNRRGTARLVLCDSCGWQALCPRCDVALTYHQDDHRMYCHSCNFISAVPSSCPVCGKTELVFRSIGTKALETELARLFPKARIARFDRDSLKAERLAELFPMLQKGEIDIIVGTQMIAKGLDLPKLSVVGVVQADSGLQIPDFTAAERTFQLLSQVSGRIGRGHRAGKLFIQTYQPGNSLIKTAKTKDFASFYETEILQRQRYRFPPFVYLLKITTTRRSRNGVLKACEMAKQLLEQIDGIYVEGPSPAFREKVAGRYSWHLVVKSVNRSKLIEAMNALGPRYAYDLDPNDLL